MAWIKSEQELASHPKLLMLAQDLEIGVPQTVGHLHLLWWWALDYCEDGYLTKYRSFIPLSAQFMGDGEFFTKKLIEHGWIDEVGDDLVIHDWMDYTGNLITVREKDRERKRKARTSSNSKNSTNKESWEISDNVNKTNKNVPRTSSGHPSDIQPPSDVRGEEKRVEESRGDIVPSEHIEFIHQDVGVVEIVNEDNVSHGNVFTALVDVFEYEVNDLTKSTRGQLNKAAKELKEVNATAHDIRERAQNFILTYGWKPTPLALVKHWADLRKPKPKIDPKELSKLQGRVTTANKLNEWTKDDD